MERYQEFERSRRVAGLALASICFAVFALGACSPRAASLPDQGTESRAAATAKADILAALLAQIPPGSDRVTFVVHFTERHALERAQNLEEAGMHAQASHLARTVVNEDFALQGLCFEQFTIGGAEIVLSACTNPPEAQRQAFQDLWIKRFATMTGVDYAEPNLVAELENRAPT